MLIPSTQVKAGHFSATLTLKEQTGSSLETEKHQSIQITVP